MNRATREYVIRDKSCGCDEKDCVYYTILNYNKYFLNYTSSDRALCT